MTNERSYSKVRLAKAPSKKQLLKDTSRANLKLISTPELVREIIPRLSEFPDKGRSIQVNGHNDSQIFANKRSHTVVQQASPPRPKKSPQPLKRPLASQWTRNALSKKSIN